jgi:hypothetical protein
MQPSVEQHCVLCHALPGAMLCLMSDGIAKQLMLLGVTKWHALIDWHFLSR